ncbi:hypothetical protein F52700_11405 [Fusarium sp. NRRL 52700]|nr:hypothetical protein F52700_11405 [Fusarium sp. NRRL 52700]
MESLMPLKNGLGLYAHDCAPAALDWAGFDQKRKKKEEEEEEKEKEKKKRKLGLGVSAPSILLYFKKAPLAHTPDPINHFPNTIPSPLSTNSLLLQLVIICKSHSMRTMVIYAEFPGVGKVQYSTQLVRHWETRIWHLLAWYDCKL